MAMDKDAELPNGFDCECGKRNEYPPYVFAHWRELLCFRCECGRAYEICAGRTDRVTE